MAQSRDDCYCRPMQTWPERIRRRAGRGRLTQRGLERQLCGALGALALVSLLFLLAPRLDLAVSRLFYDSANGFLHERYAFVEAIREAGRLVEILLAIAVTVPLAVKVVLPARPLLIRPRTTLFVLASYVIGVGMIVNGILKEYWGRARPREIVEFGGEATFSPVWWISDQCQGNCSFVSGEGAAAFWLVALVFVAPKRWRAATAAATLAFATVVSFARIAMGGHFLSDVLISWVLMLLVMILLGRVILHGLPPGFDARVEDWLAQAGFTLRQALGLRDSRPPL